MFVFVIFSIYNVTVTVVQCVSLIRHSRIIIIAIIFHHRHRRPSRPFSHHFSHHKGSSWKFILIQLSFGFALDLHNRKTNMTKLKSQYKTHFNQFPLPISIRYSGPSSSMSARGNHEDQVDHDYPQASRFFSYPFRHTLQDRFSPLKNDLCCYQEHFHKTNHKLYNHRHSLHLCHVLVMFIRGICR